MRRVQMVLGAVMIASASLAGWVGAASGATIGRRARKLVTIKLGISEGTSAANVFVAERKGYFTKEGLRVVIVPTAGAAASIPELIKGSLTMSESAILAVAQAAAHHIYTPCFGGDEKVPTKGGFFSLVARAGSGIKSAEGLVGKTIANNGTDNVGSVLIDSYLYANGVNPGSVHIISVHFGAQTAALETGAVDAALMTDPFTTEYERAGGHVLMQDAEQYILHKPVFNCWTATPGWLSHHKEAAAGFLAALGKGNTFVNAHRMASLKIVASALSVKLSSIVHSSLPKFVSGMKDSDVNDWLRPAKRFGVLTAPVPDKRIYVPVK